MNRAVTVAAALLLGGTPMQPVASPPAQRLALELQDYAALPITADNTNANTRAQLARVNYLRDEPGGRRFFVNDLNGRLYILDKRTKQFTTYLDFNGVDGRAGLFQRFSFKLNFATGLTSFIFDPDYARNGVFYTLHMEEPAVADDLDPRRAARQAAVRSHRRSVGSRLERRRDLRSHQARLAAEHDAGIRGKPVRR